MNSDKLSGKAKVYNLKTCVSESSSEDNLPDLKSINKSRYVQRKVDKLLADIDGRVQVEGNDGKIK